MTKTQTQSAIAIVTSVIASLTVLLAMLQNGGEPLPEPPVPQPLPFTAIKSDDGTATAWLIDKGGEYVLDRDLSAAETAVFVSAPTDVTLDLGGHAITFGSSGKTGCVGINPWKTKSAHLGFGENDKRFAASLPAASYKPRRLKILNGTIRHTGPPESSFACCVGGDYTFDVELVNVTLEVSGPDAACISSGSVSIVDSRCINNSRSTTNRHQVPANIRAARLTAHRNLLIGGNSGIFVGNGTASIQDNIIRNNSFATNGYGVNLYRPNGVDIIGNLIVPTNGRGILDGGPHTLANRKPLTIRNNLIIVREKPNAEFGDDLQATCIRSRYAGDNMQVDGNRCLAIGGVNYVAAVGVYLTHNPGSATNVIENNEFAAVYDGPVDIKANDWAAAMGLIGQGEFAGNDTDVVCTDVIKNNLLFSNCFAFCLSHTDRGCNQDVHCREVGFEAGNEIVNRFAGYVGDWSSPSHDGTQAAEIASELRTINISDPAERHWVYAGRWQGSKAAIVIDATIGSEGVKDVLFATRTYPFDVSINGVAIKKPESLP